jgi:hypothetical protein
MLISDMARKVPSAMSAISATAGVRVGQLIPRLGTGGRHQVGQQDAGEQAGHEQRQLQPQLGDGAVEAIAEDDRDMDGQHRAEEVHVVDALASC